MVRRRACAGLADTWILRAGPEFG